jgi:PAS domain S-box-containing protein
VADRINALQGVMVVDNKLRILILEDNPLDAELEERALREGELIFTSKIVDTKETFLRALDEFNPDVILAKYDLSTLDGIQALEIVKKKSPDVPFILVSGRVGEEFAIETLKKGVTDYVMKGNLKRLVPSINRALEEAKLRAEREKAVETLRQEKEKLSSIFEAMHDGVYIVNQQYDIEYLNPALLKEFGSVEGRKCYTYFYDLSDVCPWCPNQKVFAGEIVRREWQSPKNKKIYDLLDTPLRNADGTISKLQIFHDITECKRTEEALRESDSLYRKQFEEAVDAMFLADPETGILLDCNIAATKLIEREKSEIIGKHQSVLHPGEAIKVEFSKSFKIHVIGESSELLEDKVITKSGQIRDVAIRASKITIKGKTLIQGIFRDITESKKAEKELVKYREHLEELVENRTKVLKKISNDLKRSNEDLEQFAYAASHDLQEPLRVIAGFINLLEKRYKDKLDTKAQEFIGFTIDGVQRMQQLIKDLLEYSRVGMKDLNLVPADCSLIVDKSIANLRAAVEEAGASVTRDKLPTLVVDASQITRLFQNLIGNSMKFHGEQPVRVHVSADRKGDEWVFSVRDNGIGIDPQHAQEIFEVFRRLHARGEYPGTGIGLSICKRIVESHGGRIWVDSAPGRGSTFYFTIPNRQETT